MITTPRLHWINSEGDENVYPLDAVETIIGREAMADIVLVNRGISRRHARIVRAESTYTLIDLASTHGTYVNGRRIETHVLRDQDRIILGENLAELFFFVSTEHIPREPAAAATNDLKSALTDFNFVLPAEYSDLEKISFLLDFQHQWERIFTPEKALHQILESALKVSGAGRGFILVQREEGLEYGLGLDAGGKLLCEPEFRASKSVLNQVVSDRKPVFMLEGIEGKFAEQISIVGMGLRAIACVPLAGLTSDADEPALLGILYLDSTKALHALSGLDEKIMQRLAIDAGNVLEKLEMVKAYKQRKQLEQELALAEETQKRILPQTLPRFAGFRIHASSKPTRYVGGDFYDFLRTKPSELTGVLADVSGKGVSASLLSSMLQGCLHMLARTGVPPEEALDRINQFLCESSFSNRYATLFLFTLNSEGSGKFISAGHNPAYVFRAAAGGLEVLMPNNTILGVVASCRYQSSPLELGAGDVLVVYSDGVTDAENAEDEMLGDERIRAVIEREAYGGAVHLEQKLLDTIHKFTRGKPQTDDITILIVERTITAPTDGRH